VLCTLKSGFPSFVFVLLTCFDGLPLGRRVMKTSSVQPKNSGAVGKGVMPLGRRTVIVPHPPFYHGHLGSWQSKN
jgi:hypothetical protein